MANSFLGFLGFGTENSDKKETIPLQSHPENRLKNVYQSRDKVAKKMWEKSKNPKKTGVIPLNYNKNYYKQHRANPHYDKILADSGVPKNNKLRPRAALHRSLDEKELYDISAGLTDNAKSIKNIILEGKTARQVLDDPIAKTSSSNGGSFEEQFEPPMFGNNRAPIAPNDIDPNGKNNLSDLERKLAYDGGWSNFAANDKMSYGIYEDDELTHNNMLPQFSIKNGYGSNDLHSTADIDRKRELFTGNIKSGWRKKHEVTNFFTPQKNIHFPNGAPSFTDEMQARQYSGTRRHGEKPVQEVRVTPGLNLDYNEVGTHGYQSLYRAPEKTVDELRVKPRITYEGRHVDGMKGQAGAVQAPVISYRPDGFISKSMDDYLPTSFVNEAPKTVENIVLKDTDRSMYNLEYMGNAFTRDQALDQTQPDQMRSKHKYSNKSNFVLPTPMHKHGRDDHKFNPNTDSILTPTTAREQTGHNSHTGSAYHLSNRTYTNLMDKNKTTKRETTEHRTVTPHADCTFAQTKTPIQDRARTTLKEINAESNYQTMVTPVDQQKRAAPVQDLAKTTKKETTVQTPWNTMVTPVDSERLTAPLQDVFRTTIKETTNGLHRNNFVTPIDQGKRTAPVQDTFRKTIKETTADLHRNNVVTAVDQGRSTAPLQDRFRTTLKETTAELPRNNVVSGVEFFAPTVAPQDTFKTTIKETTTNAKRNTFVTPVEGYANRAPVQDTFRTTIKQTTADLHRQNFVTATESRRGVAPMQDTFRKTIKETTVGNPVHHHVTGVEMERGQADAFHRNPHRTTIKETLVENPLNTHTTGVEMERGQADSFHRNPQRTTVKETLVENQTNNHVTAVGQSQGQASSFNHNPLKGTIKETTVHNSHINGTQHPTQGYGYISEKVLVPDTNRQTTVTEVYIPAAQSAVPQKKSYKDAYNQRVSDKREKLHTCYITPAGRTNNGPSKKVTLGKSVARDLPDKDTPTLNPIFQERNDQDRLRRVLFDKPKYNIDFDRIMIPNHEEQLKHNPYHISIN